MTTLAARSAPATRPAHEIDELLDAELALWAADHAARMRAIEVDRLASVARFRRVIAEYTAEPAASVEGLYDLLTDRARRDAVRISRAELELNDLKRKHAERESLLRFDRIAP